MFNYNLLLKYTIIALIVAVVLKSVPDLEINDNAAIQATLLITVLIFLFE